MVTVSASSVPPGAIVTGGGAVLGTTPFVTAVPAPAAPVGATFEFTFQLPGYDPAHVAAVPTNNTITLNVPMVPALLPPTAELTAPPTVEPAVEAPEVVAPARTLSEIFDDYQLTDAGERFAWISSEHENVQVHCGEHAAEAARRSIGVLLRAFPRSDYTCTRTVCALNHEGMSDPMLFASPVEGTDGVRLVAFWNGFAGDPTRARVDWYLRELDCGEIAPLDLSVAP